MTPKGSKVEAANRALLAEDWVSTDIVERLLRSRKRRRAT
jgi:hypothetical protein